MRTTAKQILWPVRGVEEIVAYHDATPDTASQTRSYSSPFAANVRLRGAIGQRERGGSRPGMAVVSGVTEGTSPTTFSPKAPCTRGQIVTFLWRDMK